VATLCVCVSRCTIDRQGNTGEGPARISSAHCGLCPSGELPDDLAAEALVLFDQAGGAVREPEGDEVELPTGSELALLSEVLHRLLGPLGEAR
jgi:hypothetical protein